MANIYWRNGIAWGRTHYQGKTYRRSLDTKDKRIARQRLEQLVEELKGTKWGEKPRRSYRETAERFIDEHLPRLKGGIKGKSARRYLVSMVHLTETFGGKMLDDIASGLLSEFEQKRRMTGVTNSTIRRDLSCLSAIFSCGQQWEWVAANPVRAYMSARAKRGLKESPPRTRYLSHEEELELLGRCRGFKTARDGSGDFDHIMLAAGVGLSIDTGLRKEEMLSMVWSWVDLQRNEINVPASATKSGKGRTVPILPRSQQILAALPRSNIVPYVLWHAEKGKHRRYSDLYKALQELASGGRHYFTSARLTRLKQDGTRISSAVRAQVAEEADAQAWAPEIHDVRWHDLRRTCGCRLLQDFKLSMERVSKWLGHSSITQTERAYAFLEVRHLHEAVGTIARIEDDTTAANTVTNVDTDALSLQRTAEENS